MIPSRCTAPAMTLGLCHHLTQQFCDSQQTRSTTPKNMSRVQSLAPATKNGHGHLWSATAQIDFRQSFPKMVPPNHLIFGFSINHKPSWTIMNYPFFWGYPPFFDRTLHFITLCQAHQPRAWPLRLVVATVLYRDAPDEANAAFFWVTGDMGMGQNLRDHWFTG